MIKIECVAMTIMLIASSISDLKDYRISNKLIISGWLMGLIFRFVHTGISGLGDGAACIAASIAVAFPAYRMGAVGAGDIKLLSVISGMHGFGFWMRTGVLFALLASVLSLIQMLRKKMLFLRFRYFFSHLFVKGQEKYYSPERDGREMVIPLAPVLAASYYLVLLLQA